MKFIITVNVETAESEVPHSSPLSMMVMAILPSILNALGVKLPKPPESEDPEVETRDTQAPPSSESNPSL